MYALPDLCSGRMGPIKRVTSATVTMATRKKRVAGQQMMDTMDALELSDTIAEFCDGRSRGSRRGNTGNNNIYDDSQLICLIVYRDYIKEKHLGIIF